MPWQLCFPALERLVPAGHCGVLLLMFLYLPACASDPVQEQGCVGRQIVIGFAPAVDAASPATVAGLSRDAGVSVSRMRHLFDHYTLYCAGRAGEPPVTEAALQRLRERADVISVEADALRYPEQAN